MEENMSMDALGVPPRHESAQKDPHKKQTVQLAPQKQSKSGPSDSELPDGQSGPSENVQYPSAPDQAEESNCSSAGNQVSDSRLSEHVSNIEQQPSQGSTYQTDDENKQVSNIGSMEPGCERRQIKLPRRPPLEWRLNQLLDEIALSVDRTELNRIKLLFTGPDGLGKRILEQCDNCIKLFTVLKEREYISRDNVLYLNKILYVLGRQDLLDRTVKYCLDEGKVIHYYSVQGEPGTGNRCIKVHVVADILNCDQETIERLRNIVASIVCAPPEVVHISAVEPGSSFLITLTMPDMYADVLKRLLEMKVHLWRLVALEVDIIIIDGIRYAVSGECAEVQVTEQHKEIMNVYQQLEEKRRDVEQMEIISTQLREELNSVKDELKKSVDSLERVKDELSTTRFITESDVDKFRLLIQEATNKRQEMKINMC